MRKNSDLLIQSFVSASPAEVAMGVIGWVSVEGHCVPSLVGGVVLGILEHGQASVTVTALAGRDEPVLDELTRLRIEASVSKALATSGEAVLQGVQGEAGKQHNSDVSAARACRTKDVR